MGLEYFIFYTEANTVSILILSLMLLNDRLHSTQQEKQIRFNWTVIAHILYFVSDMGWAAVISGQLPRTRALVAFFNLSNFILLSLMTYEWFMYMAASENMSLPKNSRQRKLWLMPMVISVLAVLISYAAAPYFWISESGELNSLYYPALIATPVFYLLASFAFSVKNARKAEHRDERQLYWLIGVYPLGVLVFGLIQVFLLNAPLFCFGCTIMMLSFYILHMQQMISLDQLTRLNNRGQINRFMEQFQYRENARIYAIMLDIDRFKQINDTFGHAEGDRALILVAETLQQLCARFRAPVFIGRYGGDEFAIFIQNPAEDELPERAMEVMRADLAEKQQANGLLYELKISAGYDVLRDEKDTLQACLARADENLYREKRSKAIQR